MARDPLRPPGERSVFGRLVRTVLLALLVAFTVGFLIGTFLRRELDEPVRYYGLEIETSRGVAGTNASCSTPVRPAPACVNRHIPV